MKVALLFEHAFEINISEDCCKLDLQVLARSWMNCSSQHLKPDGSRLLLPSSIKSMHALLTLIDQNIWAQLFKANDVVS